MSLVPPVNLVKEAGPRIHGKSKSRAKWMPFSDRPIGETNSQDDDYEPCASIASSFYLPTLELVPVRAQVCQSARNRYNDSNDL